PLFCQGRRSGAPANLTGFFALTTSLRSTFTAAWLPGLNSLVHPSAKEVRKIAFFCKRRCRDPEQRAPAAAKSRCASAASAPRDSTFRDHSSCASLVDTPLGRNTAPHVEWIHHVEFASE